MITLYKKDSKDKIRIWKGWVEGDEVVTHTGLVDGKLKEERRKATPKNEGKANATSGAEQAQLELESKARKERDKGYFDTIDEAKGEAVILPMLAQPYDKRSKYIKWPAIVQPKLDGVRCMVIVRDGKIAMQTRKGKPFPVMPSLTSELYRFAQMLNREIILDGELYSDKIPFEELSGHCRRMNHEEAGTTHLLDLIKYNVFDCYVPKFPNAGFMDRYTVVWGFLADKELFDFITLVPNRKVDNEAAMKLVHTEFIEEGHEGTIIRNIDGPYALNERSNDLQKFKDFMDDEFKIVGFNEGEGRDTGTVIWQCATKDGSVFKCRPRGTWDQRAVWLKDGNNYLGKMLTVRFQEYTTDGIPRFPVGVAIRDYE